MLSENRSPVAQCGRIEYGAMLRHKDPVMCGVGAMAAWLFYREEYGNEPPPDMRTHQAWCGLEPSSL